MLMMLLKVIPVRRWVFWVQDERRNFLKMVQGRQVQFVRGSVPCLVDCGAL